MSAQQIATALKAALLKNCSITLQCSLRQRQLDRQTLCIGYPVCNSIGFILAFIVGEMLAKVDAIVTAALMMHR